LLDYHIDLLKSFNLLDALCWVKTRPSGDRKSLRRGREKGKYLGISQMPLSATGEDEKRMGGRDEERRNDSGGQEKYSQKDFHFSSQ
jgi:hypothetical protein